MTPFEIARQYFPGFSDDDLEWIIWEHTGYPHFWPIPRLGKTPEECFRTQLRMFREDRLLEALS